MAISPELIDFIFLILGFGLGARAENHVLAVILILSTPAS